MLNKHLKNRVHQAELLDEKHIPKSELYQNLKEFQIINRWLGCKASLIKALDKVYSHYFLKLKNKEKIVIADLGCGGGDLLEATYKWTKKKKIKSSLLGLDINPEIVEYAKIYHQSSNDIKYNVCDILNSDFTQYQFDIVCLNNVCHHFSDEILVEFLRKLKLHTKYTIIINDLHRHILSYYAIKCIVKLFSMSSLASHDGPASVLNGFKRKELIQLLQKANLDNYDIQWTWPFRWQVIIWNQQLSQNGE